MTSGQNDEVVEEFHIGEGLADRAARIDGLFSGGSRIPG
jgi:hypothetical protein